MQAREQAFKKRRARTLGFSGLLVLVFFEECARVQRIGFLLSPHLLACTDDFL